MYSMNVRGKIIAEHLSNMKNYIDYSSDGDKYE